MPDHPVSIHKLRSRPSLLVPQSHKTNYSFVFPLENAGEVVSYFNYIDTITTVAKFTITAKTITFIAVFILVTSKAEINFLNFLFDAVAFKVSTYFCILKTSLLLTFFYPEIPAFLYFFHV